MKKIVLIILIGILAVSCGSLGFGGHPITRFYVKNNSEKSINFKITIIKHNSMGLSEMTNAFTVLPKDSILARQIGFKKDGLNPQSWFSNFTVFPIDNIEMNDPNKAENWIKESDSNNKPIYTFTIAK
jgi:hypothetical protein